MPGKDDAIVARDVILRTFKNVLRQGDKDLPIRINDRGLKEAGLSCAPIPVHLTDRDYLRLFSFFKSPDIIMFQTLEEFPFVPEGPLFTARGKREILKSDEFSSAVMSESIVTTGDCLFIAIITQENFDVLISAKDAIEFVTEQSIETTCKEFIRFANNSRWSSEESKILIKAVNEYINL